MKNEIIVPIFGKDNIENENSGIEPATVKDKIKKILNDSLQEIKIDQQSLHDCISSVESLVLNSYDSIRNNNLISLDNVSIRFGISYSGKIGIFGLGIDSRLAATFQLTFKVLNNNSESSTKEQYV